MDAYQERLATPQGRLGLAKAELRLRAVEAIADAVERAGISQKDLAERLGVSEGRVSQVLGGDHNLRLNTLAEYMHALGRCVRLESTAAMEGPLESIRFQVRSSTDAHEMSALPTVPRETIRGTLSPRVRVAS